MASAILDLEGTILVATGWKDICTRFHRVHPRSAARCRESDTTLAGQLRAGERYNIYRCKNGLVDVAVPITVLGEHVANAFVGQFFLEPPDRDFFSRQAEELGFDRDAYLRSVDAVAVYSEERTTSMLDFFYRITRLMGEMGLAHKRLEDANEQLRRHQEHLQELVRERTADLNRAQEIARVGSWRWHPQTGEVQWSGGMYRVFGMEPGAPARVTHETFLARVKLEEREALRARLAELAKAGDTFSAEFHTVQIQGRERVIRLSAEVRCDSDGRPVELFGTDQDVTEEMESRRILADARDKAEAANRAKSEFLANMSHELRTPLNAVLGFSQLMKNGPSVTPEQTSYLQIISRSGEHLLDLIDSVLEISAIEAGKQSLSESAVDVRRLVHEVRSMVSEKAREKGLELAAAVSDEVPRAVTTDARKLRQILLNLIVNAVKFTAHGAVALRAGVLPGGTRLRFEVQDTGPGISADEVERVFDPFVRVGPQSVTEPGAGLGLAIARRYAEMLGGSIGVTAEPGVGSLFRVELPLRASTAGQEATEEEGPRVTGLEPGQPPRRILVVDDRPEGRLLLRKLLEPLGFEIREARDGREAVELRRAWRPDLIWMDIRMPEMDGIEATRLIRTGEAGGGERTRIVAITAHAFEEERRSILSAGCDDLLRKPFRVAEVYDALKRHLGVRFTYDGAASTAADSASARGAEPDAALLRAVPAGLLLDLRRAAELLDAPGCLRVIEAMRESEPAAFARRCVEELRFDELLETLDRACAGESP